MIPEIERSKEELDEICREFSVERLDLFGSAASGSFDPETSDLDFLVRFSDRSPTGHYAERLLDFADALEDLFSGPVHLLTEESIGNPFLRREIRNTKKTLYERSRQETLV